MTRPDMTPQRAFRPVILDELRRNGGEASIDQVYAAVPRYITLLAGDHESVAGGEPRWNNAVRQEARAMRAERLLERSRRRGIWELGPAAAADGRRRD